MLKKTLFLVVALLASTPARAGGAADADAGVARLAAGDYRTAVDLFTRAIQSRELAQESVALTYYRRGMAFYMEGETGRAILDYTVALWHEDLPRDFRPRALNNRGLAYEAINDYTSALHDYGLAIRLNPAYADAYANRGNLHRRFGRHLEAISDYDMALQNEHPRPKFVFAWQGMSFEALDRRREAMDGYRRALGIDPAFVLAKTRLNELEAAQAIGPMVNRRKVHGGTGGPLIPASPSGPAGPVIAASRQAKSSDPASKKAPVGMALRPALDPAGSPETQQDY